MRTSSRSLTPTLAEVIQTAIDANLIDMHVCLPAKIVEYDSDTQTASLLPSINKTYENGTVLPWPVIPNVPIVFPRAVEGEAYIHMPLAPGDDVTMLVCERSLDNWKETGELSDPDDRRQFDITDAFAFPGGSAAPLAFKVDDPEAIEIKNILGMLQLKPSGEMIFKNEVATVDVKETGEILLKNEVATVDIKETGDIELSNELASAKLAADGTITIENAVGTITITPSGTVNISGPFVNLGEGASHGVGLGDVIENRLSALESALSSFLTQYSLHVHATAAPGPPSPPIPPATPFVPVPIPAASVTVQVST